MTIESNASQLGRRQFLALAGAGTITVAFAGLLTGCVALPPLTFIEDMGNQYIAKVPAEGTQAVLGPFLNNPAPRSAPATLLSNLKTQIGTDYAAGQTMLITGFNLSLTEWRVCAFWAKRPISTTTTTA